MLSIDAVPFSGTIGRPPKTGQIYMAIDPDVSSGGNFSAGKAASTQTIHHQEGARLPGGGRRNKRQSARDERVVVNKTTFEKIEAILG